MLAVTQSPPIPAGPSCFSLVAPREPPDGEAEITAPYRSVKAAIPPTSSHTRAGAALALQNPRNLEGMTEL